MAVAMRTRRVAPLSGAVLVLSLVAACGGGPSEAVSSADRPAGSGEDRSDLVDVSGTVFDSRGEPVAGVAVRREYVGDEPILIPEYAIITGPEGGWSDALQPGEWVLSGILQGEETAKERVVLEDEGVEDIDLYFP